MSERTCQRKTCGKPLLDTRAPAARYCDRRCRNAAEDQRRRDKGYKAHSISVRADVFEAFEAWCEKRGVSMRSVVEPLIDRAVGAAAA